MPTESMFKIKKIMFYFICGIIKRNSNISSEVSNKSEGLEVWEEGYKSIMFTSPWPIYLKLTDHTWFNVGTTAAPSCTYQTGHFAIITWALAKLPLLICTA